MPLFEIFARSSVVSASSRNSGNISNLVAVFARSSLCSRRMADATSLLDTKNLLVLGLLRPSTADVMFNRQRRKHALIVSPFNHGVNENYYNNNVNP